MNVFEFDTIEFDGWVEACAIDSIEKALAYQLASDLGVPVYQCFRPQAGTLPCLVLDWSARDIRHTLAGASGVAVQDVVITAYATTLQTIDDLTEEIRQSLDGFYGVIGSVSFLSVWEQSDSLEFERYKDGSDNVIWEAECTYSALYLISIPSFA